MAIIYGKISSTRSQNPSSLKVQLHLEILVAPANANLNLAFVHGYSCELQLKEPHEDSASANPV